MIIDKTLSPEECQALAVQLYRYYDIEVNEISKFCVWYSNLKYYKVYDGTRSIECRFKRFPGRTVENLYLVDSYGNNIEPTTTAKEQEER